MTETPAVRIYTKPWCGYCSAARKLLDSKGIKYQDIDISTDAALSREVAALSGRNTVPQVFVHDKALGGYDDIAALDAAGKLDPLLGLQAPTGE